MVQNLGCNFRCVTSNLKLFFPTTISISSRPPESTMNLSVWNSTRFVFSSRPNEVDSPNTWWIFHVGDNCEAVQNRAGTWLAKSIKDELQHRARQVSSVVSLPKRQKGPLALGQLLAQTPQLFPHLHGHNQLVQSLWPPAVRKTITPSARMAKTHRSQKHVGTHICSVRLSTSLIFFPLVVLSSTGLAIAHMSMQRTLDRTCIVECCQLASVSSPIATMLLKHRDGGRNK